MPQPENNGTGFFDEVFSVYASMTFSIGTERRYKVSGLISTSPGQITVPNSTRAELNISLAFLYAYPMPDCCQIYMILDNAPWHKKAKRLILDENNHEYEDIRSRVKFIDIPPYSPDLNPIEQVWRLTRREVTHNRYFPNNETLAACLNDYFKQFEHHTEKMVNLCTFNFEKKNRKLKRFIRVGTFYAMKKVKEKCQTAIILWQENVPSSHLERLLTMVLP